MNIESSSLTLPPKEDKTHPHRTALGKKVGALESAGIGAPDAVHHLHRQEEVEAALAASRHLVLFDKFVGDHLILATVDVPEVPEAYLHILLENIRIVWRDNLFVWHNEKVAVSLQVGICTFANLGIYPRKITAGLMKHHLKEMAHQMYAKEPLEHLFPYDAVVTTEKVST
jgi:hypothetical protein